MKFTSIIMITLLACFAYSTALIIGQTRPDVQGQTPQTQKNTSKQTSSQKYSMGRFEKF